MIDFIGLLSVVFISIVLLFVAVLTYLEKPEIDNLAEWERSERHWKKLDGPK